MIIKFSIMLVPVSKKNSQRIVKVKNRYIPLPSKKYADYEKQAGKFIPRIKSPIDYPVNIRCLFYMPTRRRCDLTNMLEAVDDVLVKYGLLKDDNFNIIESHDGSRILYSKDCPRTEVYISRCGENKYE